MNNKYLTAVLVVAIIAAVVVFMDPFAVDDLKAADPSAEFLAARQAGKPIFLMFTSDT